MSKCGDKFANEVPYFYTQCVWRILYLLYLDDWYPNSSGLPEWLLAGERDRSLRLFGTLMKII